LRVSNGHKINKNKNYLTIVAIWLYIINGSQVATMQIYYFGVYRMIKEAIKPSKRINPFGLRIGTELKNKLKVMAEYNGRSLNAEILVRLRDSLEAKESDNATI
jgi:hypothetical protein